MDEFAQSRGDDDLFADDFEPVAAEEIVESAAPPSVAPVQRSQEPPAIVGNRQKPEGRNRGQQGRGRGSGRGASNNGLSTSRFAPPSEQSPAPVPVPSAQPAATPSTNPPAAENIPNPPSNPPQNNEATNTRTLAVRGDRSATGGPAHKKLTPEELTAKMEKMAILNAQKAERHRLSEADQAAFQHREKELAKERKEKAVAEKKNERLMEMERAKNRERKMKAQGGREWDSEKVESDIVDRKGRSSEFVRGGFGGVKRGGLAGSRFAVGEEEEGGDAPSRGRGGFEIRGRGRGRRGGRGGKAPPPIPTPEDFPSLPTPAGGEKLKSPVVDKPAGDWAEEMATPTEEKKNAL